MSFVVITRTAIDHPHPQYHQCPEHYPVEVKEYSTREQAEGDNPGFRVVTLKEYLSFKDAMNIYVGDLAPESPKPNAGGQLVVQKRKWWQLWR